MTSVSILVNPASGRGRGVAEGRAVQEALVARGVPTTVIQGTDAAHARQLCREAVDAGVDTLVACGGDGTVHLALQSVMGSSTALSILPYGTGNDIASSLGIDRRDAASAADRLLAGSRRMVDVAHVTTAAGEERWFLGVLSAGFDSMVNERANHMSFPPGQAKYVAAIVAELGVFKPVTYTIALDGGPAEVIEGMLVAIGNGTSYGGGMRVCPSAVIDDGELSVLVLGRVSKPTFLRVFPRVFRGTHITHPAVTEHPAREISLAGAGQVAYADGERIGDLPITVSVHPRALTIVA